MDQMASIGIGQGSVRFNNGFYGQAVGLRKAEVTFVVGRDPHNSTCAIIHQDVVRNEDGNLVFCDGVDSADPGIHACFSFC